MRQDDTVSPTATRVLLAVLSIHGRQGRVQLPEIMLATGMPRASVHDALVRLRALQLLAWDDGHVGTLRPLVAVVNGPWVPTGVGTNSGP